MANDIKEADVALYLIRGQNCTYVESPSFFSGIKVAHKNYHQQEAPVPRQSLDSHPRTLPSEKVKTQARIGIGYSDEEWQRHCRQTLHQDPEFFGESFGAKLSGPASVALYLNWDRQHLR